VAEKLATVLEMARAYEGPPYDLGELQPLCDLLEELLDAELQRDARWNHWLDGFLPRLVERSAQALTIRGEEYVSAAQPEPLDVEIDLGSGTVTLRFMDASGPGRGHRKRPPQDWLYEFALGTG
jgi:hypothetical protein